MRLALSMAAEQEEWENDSLRRLSFELNGSFLLVLSSAANSVVCAWVYLMFSLLSRALVLSLAFRWPCTQRYAFWLLLAPSLRSVPE